MCYKKLLGRDAHEMSREMWNVIPKKMEWVGVGVDPNSNSHSFEIVMGVLRSRGFEVPVNLDGLLVILKEVAPTLRTVRYYDVALEKEAVMSLETLKSNIRSAVLPADMYRGINQTPREQILARERVRI